MTVCNLDTRNGNFIDFIPHSWIQEQDSNNVNKHIIFSF